MNRKDLQLILAAELFVIVAVTVVFSLIAEKAIAAIVASGFFIGLGILINLKALKWESFFKSATFWVVQFHLFFSSIPLLVTRIIYLEQGFADIKVFGVPGPEFHKIATAVYIALMVATGVDWLRARKIG